MGMGSGFGGLNLLSGIGGQPNLFGPPSQDPFASAAQQSAYGNLTGAQIATQANRVNQQTPYGSLQYSRTVDQFGNPTWNATQTLSPELQQAVSGSIANLNASLENPAYGINAGETYSDAIMRRLAPIQAQQKEGFDVQMANQGIPLGSEAYRRAYDLFTQGQNDQLTSAIVGGMNTGLQAQQAQNQTAALARQLATPSYVNPYAQAATAGPDYLGAYGLSQQNQIANQNMANAQRQNMQAGLFGLGGAAIANADKIYDVGKKIYSLF
jgi:hypothetical protein